ncbi:MAG: hypothetical protein HYT40_04105 [Candidatus Sungbacteria bacterium]|uniref:Uncharacterized protein n=1 Tax=Candidatus Sungiibacteriota bacterium TaxID=2750080 RepID=A0A931SDW8_9BACT|nr:hypothetical protein [Candidatus Sungbacteria bacterium]
MFDVPVINIAFPDWRGIVYQYEYNKDLIDTGGVAMAWSPDELAERINAYLSEPSRDQAGRAKVVSEYTPFRDGCAYKRVVDFVRSLTL